MKENSLHDGLGFGPTGYSYFGSEVAENGIQRQERFICDLSHLGFAIAAGPDAISFLHGQLTNDLQNLGGGESQLTGYCTPKGRVVCIFRAHLDDGKVLLQANKSVLPSALETLRRFVLRAKLELEYSNDIDSIGVVGSECGRALAELTGGVPEQADGVLATGGVTIICHTHTAPERYQVIGPAASLDPLRHELFRAWPRAGSWAWASLDVEQCQPVIFEQTTEKFVPHSLNMDLVKAVDFHKGCYPGQEIVARMQYLGKPKYRMVRARVDAESLPAPGDKLYASDKDQSIGMLVNAVPADRGYDILTTVRIEYLEVGDLRLNERSGAHVELLDMPYTLDDVASGK